MIDLTNVPTARLHHELKLRKGPDWKCVKCGYYANGSGQWACPGCNQWHYLTGGFEWPVDNEQARAWIARLADIYPIIKASGETQGAQYANRLPKVWTARVICILLSQTGR